MQECRLSSVTTPRRTSHRLMIVFEPGFSFGDGPAGTKIRPVSFGASHRPRGLSLKMSPNEAIASNTHWRNRAKIAVFSGLGRKVLLGIFFTSYRNTMGCPTDTFAREKIAVFSAIGEGAFWKVSLQVIETE